MVRLVEGGYRPGSGDTLVRIAAAVACEPHALYLNDESAPQANGTLSENSAGTGRYDSG